MHKLAIIKNVFSPFFFFCSFLFWTCFELFAYGEFHMVTLSCSYCQHSSNGAFGWLVPLYVLVSVPMVTTPSQHRGVFLRASLPSHNWYGNVLFYWYTSMSDVVSGGGSGEYLEEASPKTSQKSRFGKDQRKAGQNSGAARMCHHDAVGKEEKILLPNNIKAKANNLCGKGLWYPVFIEVFFFSFYLFDFPFLSFRQNDNNTEEQLGFSYIPVNIEP